MSEFAPWLEAELFRQLEPAPAPESLWDRIEEGQSPHHWSPWPIAAALILMASAAALWQVRHPRDPAADLERLAVKQLHGHEGFDFLSDDPVAIGAWVKRKTNLDVGLPPGRSEAVRLLGARLIEGRGGAPVAAIAFLVGRDAATLLVSRKRPDQALSQHVFSRVESGGGARLFSWTLRDQAYTIACSTAKDLQAACLLCHTDAERLTTLN